MDILSVIVNEDSNLQKVRDKIKALSDERFYEGLFYYIKKYGFEKTGNMLDSSLPEPNTMVFLAIMAFFEGEYRERKAKNDTHTEDK